MFDFFGKDSDETDEVTPYLEQIERFTEKGHTEAWIRETLLEVHPEAEREIDAAFDRFHGLKISTKIEEPCVFFALEAHAFYTAHEKDWEIYSGNYDDTPDSSVDYPFSEVDRSVVVVRTSGIWPFDTVTPLVSVRKRNAVNVKVTIHAPEARELAETVSRKLSRRFKGEVEVLSNT